MSEKKTRKFVLVKSTSPRQPDGSFRRAGLQFNRDWRVLEVADKANLELGIIDAAILARLEAESMLAVKPATEADVAKFEKERAENKNPEQVIADQAKEIADLQGRLLKLELATKQNQPKG